MRLGPKIAGGFATCFVATLVVALLSWRSARELVDTLQAVSRTQEVLLRLNQALGHVAGAEAGVRGFVISGHDELLQSYRESIRALPEDLHGVARLTEDDPAQHERFDRLRGSIERRLAHLNEVVAAHRNDRSEEAASVLHGKRLMDDLRQIFDEMTTEESRLLRQRMELAQRRTRAALFALVGSLAALAVLLLTGTMLLARSITRPLGLLVDRTRRLGRGEAIRPIELRTRDELQELAAAFNDMAARRHRAEAALDALVRASPLAVVSVDADRLVLTWNPAAERLFGWRADEVLGKPLPVVPDDKRAEFEERASGVLGGNAIATLETVRQRKDGTRIDVSVAWAPLSIDGERRGMMAVIEDIGPRKRDESERARLLESEQRERLRLEAIRDSVLSIDEATTTQPALLADLLRVVVDQARTLTGADYAALGIGTDPEEPFDPWVYSGMSSEVAAHIGRTPHPLGLLGVVPQLGESMRVVDVNRDARAVGLPANHPPMGPLLGVPVHHRGRTVGNLYLARRPGQPPFSDSDQSTVELLASHAANAIEHARLNDELRVEVRAREQLMAIVSHDLKNLLNVISLREQLLHSQTADPAIKTHAQTVLDVVQRLQRMIRDLLDAATLEGGALRPQLASCDLGQLLDEAMALVQPIAADREVRLEWYVDESVTVLRCDRERVLQVLANLVGNALRFTPAEGRVAISVRRDAGGVLFAVTDTGPGLPAEALPHLFERFWTTASRQGGTGLGLFIAKGIVEAHGGRIWASSNDGQGSTFCFTLPDQPLKESIAGLPLAPLDQRAPPLR